MVFFDCMVGHFGFDDDFDEGLEILERLSNGVLELIDQGRLDDAEKVCGELLRRYPDQIDGIDRMALVYEKRGDTARAVERHERCLIFIVQNPDGFDDDSVQWHRSEIDRLRSLSKKEP